MKNNLEELLKMSQIVEMKKDSGLIDAVECYNIKLRISREFKSIAQNKPVKNISLTPSAQVGIADFVDILVSSN